MWRNPTIRLPSTSKSGGWLFKGWFTTEQTTEGTLVQEPSGADYVGPSGTEYAVSKPTTLYAHWFDDRITITYDKNFS